MGISSGRVSASGGEWKTACNGNTSAPILDDDGRELQGAKQTGSSSNGCGTASASSSCSHRGPKHHRVAALCAEAAARFSSFFCKSIT
jgi:hypothetical protein